MGFADGMGLYAAFGNNPATNLDPTGRFLIPGDVGELLNAGYSALRGDREAVAASLEAYAKSAADDLNNLAAAAAGAYESQARLPRTRFFPKRGGWAMPSRTVAARRGQLRLAR